EYSRIVSDFSGALYLRPPEIETAHKRWDSRLSLDLERRTSSPPVHHCSCSSHFSGCRRLAHNRGGDLPLPRTITAPEEDEPQERPERRRKKRGRRWKFQIQRRKWMKKICSSNSPKES
uniref:Uncharacterized protein n=2 Tax=Aegilops tauschii subsp. strangulata TaxID=200361 RepID=A0A453RS80_AEGTS